MKSKTIDLLKGPIMKSLLLFMLPILISNIFQQFYNTMDTAIVGNVLGPTSLSAMGASNAIFDLLVGLAMGIGNGLAIVTGRSFGSGDRDLVKKSVVAAVVIGIVSSVLISVIAHIGLYPLLKVLKTHPKVINEAYSYISIIAICIIVMFMYNLCAGLLRAIGDSIAPLVFLVISSILNIGLDYSLIKYAHMGVRGAAVATVIAQGVSVILCIFYIFKKVEILVPEKRHFTYDPELYKEMIGQGYSMAFMNGIVSAGSVILQSGINSVALSMNSEYILGAHTTARKLYMFFNMPFTSMGIAISTFVSQNKGADQPGRIRQAMRDAYLYDVIVAAVTSILLWVLAPTLVKWVSGSTEPIIVKNASLYLYFVGPNYAVLGVLMQTRFGLQGLGMKILPLISSVIEFFGKILFVVVFIPKYLYMAVIVCEPAIWIVMTIQLVITFWTYPYIRDCKKS